MPECLRARKTAGWRPLLLRRRWRNAGCALLEACGLQMAKVPLRARCDVAAFLLALFTCPTVVVIRIEHLLPRAGRH